jgi:carboxyl-terminal processing protease
MVGDQNGLVRPTVFRVLDDSSAAISGVESGWILQSINGTSVEELTNSVSGEIEGGQSTQSESDSLSFFVIRSLNSLVNGDFGETVNLSFLDRSDTQRELSINPIFREGNSVRLGHLPEVISQFRAETLEPSHIGLIQFDIFMGPIIPQITEAIQLFNDEEVNGLVIDIRGNPGGIAGMATGIVGHLISSREMSLGEMYDRNSHLDLRVFPRPRSQRFEGPVALLVDELSASTSEFLAAGLQDLNRGRIFGQTTAGMALPSTIESLPNGDILQFVIFNMIRGNGERIEGYGVTPDESAALTRAALISGHDPALNQAVNWITETP